MNTLKFNVITDLAEAKTMWELFSPQNTIDDEWRFRYAFYKYLHFPLHFIVGYDGEKPVGLLPLQLNTNQGMSTVRFQMNEPFLEFFGGIDTDDNKVFILPEYQKCIPDFLQQVTTAAVLAPLADQYSVADNQATYYTDKFVVDLKGLTNLDMFLDKNFQGKSRRRLRGKINHFYKNYKIEIKKGTESDLELLFALNIKRFGTNSAFHMEHRKQLFRDLVKLYTADIFTIVIDDKPKAVSLSLVHKGTYSGLNSGYDYAMNDLGKFVFITKIQRAIEMGCAVFDAGKNDNGWKEHFHLQKITQYKLTMHLTETETQLVTSDDALLDTEQFPVIP